MISDFNGTISNMKINSTSQVNIVPSLVLYQKVNNFFQL